MTERRRNRFPGRRPARTRRAAISSVCSLFFFILVAFPAYCDKCSYRNLSLVDFGAAVASSPVRSCCDGAAQAGGDRSAAPLPEKEPRQERPNLSHAGLPYCVTGSLLQSIPESSDCLAVIRRLAAPAGVRSVEAVFVRQSPVFVHKDPRAPPA